MSELDSRFVKRGLWTRVDDQGPLTGRTITADVQSGTIVVALLAVLSSISTAYLWNLVAFTIHQLRADGLPADGLFRHQQVLFRTLPTPASLFADSVKLWLYWRKQVDRAMIRSIIPILLGASFSVASVAVGILSSYLVAGNNVQVLVNSPFCAPLNIDPTNPDYTSTVWGLSMLESKTVALAKAYARDCYQTNGTLPGHCSIYIRPNITFTQERVDCPFPSSLCIDMQQPAISFDSGLVDLNDGFGLNLGSKDRVKFRKHTACAILDTAHHSTIINASDYDGLGREAVPGEEVIILHYGNMTYDTPWPNATFDHSLTMSNLMMSYQTGWERAYSNPLWADMNDFFPIPELSSTDRDLVLVSLWKNAMGYGHPVDDPVFAAHKKLVTMSARGLNDTFYLSDSPGSILGCTQQYQFCFAQDSKDDFCTSLMALPGMPTPDDYPQLSPVQLAAMELLISSNLLYDIADAVLDTLKAGDLAVGTGWLDSLPSDQWIQEIAGWESVVWAALQTAIPDYAIGHAVREPTAAGYVRNTTTEGEKALCRAQRAPVSGRFVSINAFGLVLIATFSCAVVILDLTILRILVTLSRFRRAMAPRLDRWVQDGVFQLQRRAYEACGEGVWLNVDKEVPVTVGEKRLNDLPIASGSVLEMRNLQECATCLEQKKLRSIVRETTDSTIGEGKG